MKRLLLAFVSGLTLLIVVSSASAYPQCAFNSTTFCDCFAHKALSNTTKTIPNLKYAVSGLYTEYKAMKILYPDTAEDRVFGYHCSGTPNPKDCVSTLKYLFNHEGYAHGWSSGKCNTDRCWASNPPRDCRKAPSFYQYG